ncbi:hypothetical protein QFZ77_002436 [Paenibacillus sp. V4I3]|uniref:hypothetical protein n=1 Tax=Paenibacillus sp. V4I3 TaxID=3042305 RepID=UPI00277F1C05|nr:hypothetical protein [Paenibacillus sp. V4I3]MDQ0873777.1 hypothetical protein [Paenibacillus sp. V4I3]
MIEQIKKTLQKMTNGSDWTNFDDCEDSKTVFEYDRLTERTCDIIADCQTIEMAQFIANIPECLRYLIGEVERLKPHPVICGKGYCKSPADDYVGMFMSNEECPACNAHHMQVVKENEELQKALEYIADEENCFDNLPLYAQKAIERSKSQ